MQIASTSAQIPAPNAERNAAHSKVEDAAEQFEALLIAQMLKAARGDEGGWLGSGEDSTASSAMGMAEEFLASALSAQGGLGLASLIRQGLDRPAETAPLKITGRASADPPNRSVENHRARFRESAKPLR